MAKLYARTLILLWFAVALPGCQTTAPVHVWVPARIAPLQGKRVLVADIVGPQPLAKSVQQALLISVPATQADCLLVTQDSIQSRSDIQLASALDVMPSDMALIHVARHNDFDYVLFGEILRAPEVDQTRSEKASAQVIASVSWKLFDVKRNEVVGGMPVTAAINTKPKSEPEKKIPISDLQQEESVELVQPSRTAGELASLIGKRSWNLLAAHVGKSQATLAHPWTLAGSNQVRQANELASKGDWPGAEKKWREAFAAHPSNHAALHNLAIAAAAKEDYVSAKQLARQALAMHSSAMYEDTVVWIEQRQVDFVRGFNLPEPSEGWLIVRPENL